MCLASKRMAVDSSMVVFWRLSYEGKVATAFTVAFAVWRLSWEVVNWKGCFISGKMGLFL